MATYDGFDVTLTYVGTSNPPTASTTIAVGPRQRADYDSARTIINLSDGVP